MIAGALALSGLGAQYAPARAENMKLTVDQSRGFALRLIRQGHPELALPITEALLKRDPDDLGALMLQSQALGMLGRTRPAVAGAKHALRIAKRPGDRFQAALLVGRALGAGRRWLASEYWLRRAVDMAPDARARQVAVETFRRVRQLDPWSLKLDFSVAPSSNVNGGAQSSLLTISGLPFTGVLSGTAQALSGRQAQANVTLAYRVSGNARQMTRIGARFYGTATQLTSQAKAIAPTAKGSDFDVAQAEVFLKHNFLLGQSKDVNSIGLTFGKTWYGGDPYDNHLRLDLSRSHRIDRRNWIRFSGSIARQNLDTGDRTIAYSLQGDYVHDLTSGDSVNGALGLLDVASANGQLAHYGAWARIGYDFGRPFGPVTLSASLTVGINHYQNYAVLFYVPGGRNDGFVQATISARLDKLEVLGFAPVLSLTADRTHSNVSRFTAATVGVGLGIRSTF